jgi:hypothetical protein
LCQGNGADRAYPQAFQQLSDFRVRRGIFVTKTRDLELPLGSGASLCSL